MLNVDYRLRDRLSDDRNAQNLLKGFLGKCNDWRIDPLRLFFSTARQGLPPILKAFRK